MFKSSQPSLSRRFCKALCLAALVAISCLAPAQEQKQKRSSTLPKYDASTERKIKGTVVELKLLPPGAAKQTMHLVLKGGTDPVDVYLCPKTFLEEMGVVFSKGDEIQVTGSKVNQEGTDVILAREVVKGNDTLVLRDDKGKPVWNWRTVK